MFFATEEMNKKFRALFHPHPTNPCKHSSFMPPLSSTDTAPVSTELCLRQKLMTFLLSIFDSLHQSQINVQQMCARTCEMSFSKGFLQDDYLQIVSRYMN